ncbi:MAG: electron transfer flavoprotein subunit beta/FixA family protein, partial [Proteobacteria bacterium]|nr:electron transfer flavoprotein subunit beta/FixA family protein [Burkholderiales bacterium]
MHIAVCVKHVPSPDAAFSMFRIDAAAKNVVPVDGLPWVMSPFDEQAVEAALRIRDAHPGTRVTLLTLGADAARNTLRHGLAMGADDAVLLVDPAFDDGDSYTTALVLARALATIGPVDLVLAGRQAADFNAGVVGAGLAELLGLPIVTFACEVRIQHAADAATARVTRVLDDGCEVVDVTLPAVVTVSNELGAARV